MSQFLRHRVVNSISLKLLHEEVNKLLKAGWRTIGDPALATPADLNRPPYWVQAMYLAPEEVPVDSHTVKPPAHSVLSVPGDSQHPLAERPKRD